LAGQLKKITMSNGFTYSVQDLAFKQWFYNRATTTGFNGLPSPSYSMFGSLKVHNPPAVRFPCRPAHNLLSSLELVAAFVGAATPEIIVDRCEEKFPPRLTWRAGMPDLPLG
jgi:hypothetical protein